MKDHLNSNSLVDGNIPSGVGCPFIEICNWVDDSCPTKGRLKKCRWSCGAARSISLIKCREEDNESQ